MSVVSKVKNLIGVKRLAVYQRISDVVDQQHSSSTADEHTHDLSMKIGNFIGQ
jgi:hypothetical protein